MLDTLQFDITYCFSVVIADAIAARLAEHVTCHGLKLDHVMLHWPQEETMEPLRGPGLRLKVSLVLPELSTCITAFLLSSFFLGARLCAQPLTRNNPSSELK